MYHRQIICGLSITIFLIVWTFIDILINGLSNLLFLSTIVVSFLIVFSFIDNKIARFLQGYMLIIESSFILALYPVFELFGWSFFITGIALLVLYGFFHNYTLLKSIIIVFLLIFSLLTSFLLTGRAIYSFLQTLFVISVLPIVGLDNLKRIIYNLPDYKTLTEELKIRETEVNDLEIQLENQKLTLNSEMKNREVHLINEIERLKGFINGEGETEKLKAELEVLKAKAYVLEKRNAELEAEIKVKKEGIIADYINIEARLEQLEMLSILTRGEKNLVIKFYLSRGVATNAMLSDELCKSETTIKNTFRSTFRKLNVPSRSALMGQLDDWMNKSIKGISERELVPLTT